MKISVLTITFALFTSVAFAEAKPPAGELACRACHGEKGAKPITPDYPKLNGQNKSYLVNALKAYKSGNRKGGLAAVMTAQASSLSEDAMKALAEYYSKQQ